MKKLFGQLFYIFKLLLITIPCVFLTFYIAVNCYEVLFRQDLRYVNAVSKFSSANVLNEIANKKNPDFDKKQDFIKNVHKPKSLKFASINSRLELIPAIEDKGEWLAYANKGHFILLNENSESGIGNMLVYIKRNWRILIDPNELETGTKFTLETENYNNLYKIVEKKIKPINEIFVLNDLPKSYLVLVIEDKNLQVNYYIKAVFVSQDKNI